MFIHQYVEVHSISQPDAIALKFKQSQFTYGQLHEHTHQLSCYLNNLGIGSEDRVVVFLEPSLEIVVSLLAIFKVGGTYVPLDPSYPSERLANLLAEIQPNVVITQEHLLPNLPVTSEHVFCIDRDWQTIQDLPAQKFDHEITPQQTAYIIYTSGTTGKPKGVMVSHSNLLHYILVAQEEYGFNAQDVMPAIARFTFSISLFELLSPLVAGGTLLILERDRILDFEQMVQVLKQVTVIHAGPSLLRALLTHIEKTLTADPQQFQQLRHVSTGGDMVPVDILERMRKTFQHAEMFVIYGCSEVSCMGCTYSVPRQGIITKSLVGKPFNNVFIHLYDESHNVVPIGVTGEIYVGGAGVAKEYLYREQLTQEKFITIDGVRFYRTGDLGRFEEDGNLEVLGRSDFQIKLRGIRIELNEIETILRQAPGVMDGVVTSCDLETGEKGLVAYVVLEQGKNFIVEIRRFLQAKLPDYMVPTIFMELEAMPLNINQKLNRLDLPAPTLTNAILHNNAYVAPRTELEEILTDIYARTLKLERIGIYDNFFEFGGHSLMATQVIYRLQEILESEIPVSQLFVQPTVAGLAEYITTAKQNKDDSYLTLDSSVQRRLETNFPLLSSQQQLWFLTQLEGGNAAYNIPLAFKIFGELDILTLERSLNEILQRHDSLRSIFPVIDGLPVQQILPLQFLPLRTINLLTLTENEQTEKTYQLAREEAQRPFDLTKDLLIRSTLLQLGENSNVLLLTTHHIVSDDWSIRILQKEMSVIYTAFRQGRISPLKVLDIQYVDYVYWQQKRLNEKFLDQQLVYWEKQLAYAPPLLDFPTDHPRPVAQTYRGETEFFTLDLALTRQIKILSQRTGVTLFMSLLSAFAILLSRYSRQQDVVIGSPIANRNRKELESLIGCFINLLALRIDLTGDPTFTEFIQRVKDISLGAYAHQELPFEKLVEKLCPNRSFSYSPIFQVMFVLQNAPVEISEPVDLKLIPLNSETGTAQYDLTLMMEETEIGLSGHFEYNSGLFNRLTIKRLISHFQILLESIVKNPKQSISQLPILTEREKHQLLVEWNDTNTDYPQDKCIHQLFEEQVERTPDAIAVSFQDQNLTYRELNRRANQLAHYLQNLGVKPNILVGICIERSLEMMVGLMGILKAGGAYVPLDPNYPPERIEYMIADAQMPVLLTQSKWKIQEHQAQVICLDSDWEKIASQNSDNPAPIHDNQHVAYVIYTSGSTGKPKGVMIGQKALVSFVQTAISEYGFSESDRVLQFASINFDAAVEEIFPSLCTGATLVLRTDKMLSDLRTFFQACEDLRLSVLDLPTAYWHQLAAELASTNESFPESLRLVIIGGEKVLLEPVRDWQKYVTKSGKGDRLQLINTYGPTETTVVATLYRIPITFSNISEVPIGRPLAHLQTYILDSQLQPVPIGVTGELHIGGDSLAIGYLNRPELTDEKFIPNPFSSQSGSRLYKTGDLARYLSDGNIEYLGRIDNQVKIRGFRIELGEVETALSQHPLLRATIVTTREDTPGDKRLVAYVVTEDQTQDIDLRAFLKDRLPSYMIPSAFVFLEEMPITPNGKIDYRRLPAPDASSMPLEKNFVPPRNSTEETLAKIWSQILGVERVGINDNFFELGGHSLLSVRLISEIEKTFNYQIPLSSFFEMGTIAEIAKWMCEKPSETISPEDVPLGLSLEDYRAFLSLCGGRIGKHIGKRGLIVEVPPTEMKSTQPFIWIGYIDFSKNLGLPQPVYTIPGGSWTPLHSTENYIEAIASVIVDEILSIPQDEPYLIGGNCYEGLVAMEVACQLQKKGKKVDFLAIIDKEGPSKIYDVLCQLDLKLCILKFHLMQFLPLSLTEKGKYILERLFSFNAMEEINKSENELDFSQFMADQSPEKPHRQLSEHDLILPQAWDSIDQVSRNHSSKVFSGKVVLTAPTKSGLKSRTKDVLWTDLSWLFPYCGWGKLLTGKVSLHKLDCAHADVGMKKNAEQIGQIIWKACEEFR
ncbi:amino acid adenylation domain-containing protein [Pseudanabaena galeata UHCC 0370]|uniref:Amino acid adenylation domain-containing protein n=1 Tax=Pseudanabaena galeata UHCC 0370 TaxID=3110310 RepID=A0ABU5TCM3_9CYAN|nr:non-ribosomal peptide synthetase [Pseudanabaena galeata]MEA5476035.1 amino acid adenylation domain-containing protein [Pseudanabaena galeata UHCC 0370]